MKKKTIIYIITKLELGGAQKICLSLFNQINSDNFNSYIFSGKEGFFSEEISKNPNTYLFENFKREVSLLNLLNEIKTFFKLIKKLKEIKKNQEVIVHTHSTKAGILGRWAAFFAGIKNRVHTIHGFGFHNNQNKIKWSIIYLIELITSLITTHFICVSSQDTQTGIKLFPNFKNKYTIIRAAIEYEKFYEPAYIPLEFPKTTPFIFGTISCFKPQKNLIDLLQAFKIVHKKNSNIALEIVGDGEQRTKLENWIKQNNLENNITLHGWQVDVRPFLKKWNSFILSSLWEGLPCSIVEARMYKLPILSYDTGGIKEIVIESQNGFIYPQKNWQALANGMLEISLNRQLYYKLQNFNDNLLEFKDSYMIEQHTILYKKIYQDL